MAWHDKLAAGVAVLLDGSTGSELQRRGVPVDHLTWNAAAALSHYDTLVDVHTEFVRAGAEVITTNTFATNRFVLDGAGLSPQFLAINEAAVSAARQAASSAAHPVTIAGSMSCLPPGFDTANYPDERTERDGYRELAATLAELGVDIIIMEMMQDTRHSAWAVKAASETGLPVWLGISCRLGSVDGTPVAFDYPKLAIRDCLRALMPYEPSAVNVMHSPCDSIIETLRLLESEWGGPVGVYPEVGCFDPITRQRSERTSPEDLASQAHKWLHAGALIVGACCGSTPEHIGALRAVLNS